MFAQHDCDVSNEWYEADDAADDVFFAVEEGLAGGVELGVVCEVVVALGEEAEGCLAARELAHVLVHEGAIARRDSGLPASLYAPPLQSWRNRSRLTLHHIS